MAYQLEQQIARYQDYSQGEEVVTSPAEQMIGQTINKMSELLALAASPFSDKARRRLMNLPGVNCPHEQLGLSLSYQLEEPNQILNFVDEALYRRLSLKKQTMMNGQYQQSVAGYYPQHESWRGLMFFIKQNFEADQNLASSETIIYHLLDADLSRLEIEKQLRPFNQGYRQVSLKVGDNLSVNQTASLQLIYNLDSCLTAAAPDLILRFNLPNLAGAELQASKLQSYEAQSHYEITFDSDNRMLIKPVYQPLPETIALENLQAMNQDLLPVATDSIADIMKSIDALQLQPAS